MDKINANQHLEELIDTYQNLIFSICCKMTGDYFAAEDLTQDTFLSALLHMDSFEGGNEKAWICRIASNKCIDYLKSAKQKTIPQEDDILSQKASPESGPEDLYLESEVKQQLLTQCSALKSPYNVIAHLYFYEEKKPEEIAALQDKNLKTVQTQIYRAKAMLRKIYEKERKIS